MGKMKSNREKTRYFWIILVSCLFILSNGCASKEEKKAKHWKRARQYIEKKEFKKAVIELKNVIQLAPEDDEANYELGETYLKLGNRVAAAHEVETLKDLDEALAHDLSSALHGRSPQE